MYKAAKKILLEKKERLDHTNTWLLFLFFGWSYGGMGQGWKQFFYYITLGGFGIWVLVRLFTLNSDIKKYNRAIYAKYRLDKGL